MEHAYNTFLNAVSIGDNFSCFHNVTVGQKGGKLPTIGNNVTVSCGASILGDVVIGNNVVVGAGCVVVHGCTGQLYSRGESCEGSQTKWKTC